MWYLTADRYNDSITKSATMWKQLRQPDGGGWFSNYGQYWFAMQYMPDGSSGFDWVVESLIADKDSRQAIIPMLSTEHLFPGNKDVVCTYSVGFRIRNERLHMTVNMRSQDAMWGMTNDIFCFSILHEMIYVTLRDLRYPDLIMGPYTHKVDSFHIYEHHFDMLRKILEEGQEGYYEIDCPKIYDHREVINLIEYRREDNRPDHLFTEWLYANKYADGNR
jgi:thymidylate synthase